MNSLKRSFLSIALLLAVAPLALASGEETPDTAKEAPALNTEKANFQQEYDKIQAELARHKGAADEAKAALAKAKDNDANYNDLKNTAEKTEKDYNAYKTEHEAQIADLEKKLGKNPQGKDSWFNRSWASTKNFGHTYYTPSGVKGAICSKEKDADGKEKCKVNWTGTAKVGGVWALTAGLIGGTWYGLEKYFPKVKEARETAWNKTKEGLSKLGELLKTDKKAQGAAAALGVTAVIATAWKLGYIGGKTADPAK